MAGLLLKGLVMPFGLLSSVNFQNEIVTALKTAFHRYFPVLFN